MIIWYLLNEIHVQKPAIDYHADISCQAGSKFGLSLHLLPYFVYASSKGSGQYAHKRTVHKSYLNLVCLTMQ